MLHVLVDTQQMIHQSEFLTRQPLELAAGTETHAREREGASPMPMVDRPLNRGSP